ncbi:bifunctional diguanylate cyclase/phosphodiesterase [Sphingomonas sp. ID1715]|uniref:putative bifunctional diguanylate cyclase/phosphodiesterase n=1 Tax=Sphingomonas sp. ID1715 TaxID=1656898 RepID=UPI001C2BA78F|nr:EAL domain-containing protein [Sphingomonas sp. ID1715]
MEADSARLVELEQRCSLLQTVIDSVRDLIFAKDRGGRFILSNKTLQDACGLAVGQRTTDLFDEGLVQGYEAADQIVIATGRPLVVDETIPILGEDRQFQTVKVPWISDGEVKGVIGVSRDLTERMAAEAALKQSECLHRGILEASADCIIVMSVAGEVQLMNGPGAKALELDTPAAAIGKSWSDLWPKANRRAALAALGKAARGEVARFTARRLAEGSPRWWDVMVTPIVDDMGAVTRLLSISRDISESKHSAEQLRWTSEHDALTELANRHAFQARLQAAALRTMRTGRPFGLLLLDMDRFKQINDTLGHAAGDDLLRSFGHVLKQCVRETDFVARLGGDEFAIIVDGVKDAESLERVGNMILDRLNVPMRVAGREVSAGASIGGALFPGQAASANELLNNADIALYALKGSGRGGTRIFHGAMREQAQQVASQLNLARVALCASSVVPHYQPKVNLRTGRLVGYEALLRWMHPQWGLQLPATVQEAFKEYELASKIGDLMLGAVVADMQQWLGRNLSFGRISINAAPAEFLRDDYAERLLRTLEASEIPTHLIEVEVTEHVFLERGSEFVERALKLLNSQGVRIALDDFGTGYSSLSHLRDFPVDVVKIDRSFVERMVDEPEISAIVSAVISLAADLNIEVVAEGLETQQQRCMLMQKRCSFGQGYLFGRPVTAAEVEASLRLDKAA